MHFADRAVIAYARWMQMPTLALIRHQPLLRLLFAATSPLAFGRPLPGTRKTSLGGVSARTRGGRGPGALLWFHGGGFTIGSAYTHAPMLTRLAAQLDLPVWLPDYRLAPEHPYPSALDDCRAAYAALAAQTDGPIVLGGDSAGGALALSLLHDILEAGDLPTPACILLAAPVVNLAPDRTPPPHTQELVVPLSWAKRCIAMYVGPADPADPRLSPLHGQFNDAPPILFQCAERELLEGDTDAMATTLRAQGAEVTVQKTPHMPHVWQMFNDRSPAARSALRAMAEFARKHMPVPKSPHH